MAVPHQPAARAASPVRPPARASKAIARGDAIAPLWRCSAVGAVVLLHALAGWALLRASTVREAAVQTPPIFVEWIAAPAAAPEPVEVTPPPEPPPPPPLKPQPPPPKPKPAKPKPRPEPAVQTVPETAPATPAALAPPPQPVPPAPEPPPVAAPQPQIEALAPVPAPPVAPVAPPPPPKILPASAVQYLEPPAPVYPRAAQRRGESGRVLLRVFIDTAGVPRQIDVDQSSGFARLDEAATAAVRRARFKPYIDGGRPIAGWAFVPIEFQLESSR